MIHIAGSTQSRPGMAATPSADGFVLDGGKVMVEAGAQADWLLVTARAPQGLTQFLLPASTPGFGPCLDGRPVAVLGQTG